MKMKTTIRVGLIAMMVVAGVFVSQPGAAAAGGSYSCAHIPGSYLSGSSCYQRLYGSSYRVGSARWKQPSWVTSSWSTGASGAAGVVGEHYDRVAGYSNPTWSVASTAISVQASLWNSHAVGASPSQSRDRLINDVAYPAIGTYAGNYAGGVAGGIAGNSVGTIYSTWMNDTYYVPNPSRSLAADRLLADATGLPIPVTPASNYVTDNVVLPIIMHVCDAGFC